MITAESIHSIKFVSYKGNIRTKITKNTWEDWGLVPTSRPLVSPPTRKQKIIDIPGMSGYLDLSNVLVGQNLYNRRTGTWEFAVYNPQRTPWNVLYDEIMNFFIAPTEKIDVYLLDDPRWYYTGYVAVKEWKSNSDGTGSKITFEYELEPYKRFYCNSLDSQEMWDMFSFEDYNSYYTLFDKKIPRDILADDWAYGYYRLAWSEFYKYGITMPTMVQILVTFENINDKVMVEKTNNGPDGSSLPDDKYVLDYEHSTLKISINSNTRLFIHGTNYGRGAYGKPVNNGGSYYNKDVVARIRLNFEIGRL